MSRILSSSTSPKRTIVKKYLTKFLSEELKEEAEAILQELEIPMSTAQEIFYRQIIAYGGLLFELCVPQKGLPYR